MVSTDGNMYLEYEVRNTNNNVITSDTLYLYNSTGGTSVLSSTIQDQALLPGPIIPDGNGGVLATWTVSPSHSVLPFPYQAADVTNGTVGTPYNLPFSPSSVTPFVSPNLVLGENGVAFASGTTTAADGVTQVSQIASFNVTSGAPNWTYQSSGGASLSIIAATRGNGIVAKIVGSQPETVVTLDSNGNPTTNSGASVGTLTDYTWWGDWNTVTNGAASGVFAQRAQVANDSPSPTPRGNPSHTSKAGVRCAPLDSATSTLVEGAFSNLNNFLLNGTCTFCVSHIFEPLSTSQAEFEAYLSQGHEFCDGNKSQEPGSMIGSKFETVALEFAANAPSPGFEAAATEVQDPIPIVVGFFKIQSSQLPNLRVFLAYQNLTTDPTFVESLLFHEGLHGETRQSDAALCSAMNVPSQNADCWNHSVDITCWIAKEVFLEQNLPGLPQWCPDIQF